MTADQLEQDIEAARKSLKLCCGPIIFKYEPGCTFAKCANCGRKVSRPDWAPEEVAEAWNDYSSYGDATGDGQPETTKK